MTRPTVSQAEAWRPDSLRRLADEWDEAARRLAAHVDTVMREIRGSHEFWTGATADVTETAAEDRAEELGEAPHVFPAEVDGVPTARARSGRGPAAAAAGRSRRSPVTAV